MYKTHLRSSTKAFTQEEPSIQFGEAASVGRCSIGDQLTGEDGRTISIGLNDFQHNVARIPLSS